VAVLVVVGIGIRARLVGGVGTLLVGLGVPPVPVPVLLGDLLPLTFGAVRVEVVRLGTPGLGPVVLAVGLAGLGNGVLVLGFRAVGVEALRLLTPVLVPAMVVAALGRVGATLGRGLIAAVVLAVGAFALAVRLRRLVVVTTRRGLVVITRRGLVVITTGGLVNIVGLLVLLAFRAVLLLLGIVVLLAFGAVLTDTTLNTTVVAVLLGHRGSRDAGEIEGISRDNRVRELHVVVIIVLGILKLGIKGRIAQKSG